MKITGPKSLSSAPVGQGGGRPAAAGMFAVPHGEDGGAAALARTAGLSGVSSIDALIALQQVEEPGGRRRRAVRRAGKVLDALDEVKLKLIDGEPDASDLERLSEAVREQRASTDDPGLNGLLDQIETRAAVELAKIEARLQAA